MSFWSGRSVFLTGHSGFKGGWLALWLARLGARVTGYSLEPPTTPSLFEVAQVRSATQDITADVRDVAKLRNALAAARPNVVFHLAAQPLVRESYADPLGTYATNVLGTANLLQAAREVPAVQAVVVVTSDKCYENLERSAPYTEADRLGGHDPYSSSKACAELVAQSFRDSFQMRVATARAGNVIGGGDWAADRLIPDLVRAAAERRPTRIRYPKAVRPWQHVLEPLAGYLGLAERLAGEGGERYAEAWNFGPDDADCIPVQKVADDFVHAWGAGARWEPEPGQHPHEAQMLRLDASKARARLGWRPVWNVARALERSVAWYRAWADGADMDAKTLEQIAEYEAALASAQGPR